MVIQMTNTAADILHRANCKGDDFHSTEYENMANLLNEADILWISPIISAPTK